MARIRASSPSADVITNANLVMKEWTHRLQTRPLGGKKDNFGSTRPTEGGLHGKPHVAETPIHCLCLFERLNVHWLVY